MSEPDYEKLYADELMKRAELLKALSEAQESLWEALQEVDALRRDLRRVGSSTGFTANGGATVELYYREAPAEWEED